MSEMVERVARALEDEAEIIRDQKEQVGPMGADAKWSRLARAALASLREPTKEMIEAGAMAVRDCYSLEPGEGFDEPPGPAAYQAMIDEALK